MALDSPSVFEERLRRAGLDDTEIKKCQDAGWATLGDFAFSSSYVPGGADDSAFVAVCNTILGLNSPKQAQLRRVFFEAYTFAAGDLKRRMETSGGDDERARKLPEVERNARYERQKAKLAGLDLTGELEVSHQLTPSSD